TDITLSNTKSASHAPGACTVIENAPAAGWNLTTLACTDPSGGTTTSVGTRTASIDLAPGETVSCTFTNTKDGALTIIKDAVPNDAQDFSFSGTCFTAFSLDDDTNITLSNTKSAGHAPGTCTVIEDAPVAGWAFTTVSCFDPSGDTTVNVGTRTATIALAAGESVTCTFTNTKLATIIVQKTTDPGGDAQAFSIGLTGPTPGSGSITDATDQFFTNLAGGSYTITETVPGGWRFDSATCDAGGPSQGVNSVSLTLGAGQTITCTFHNTRIATFTVNKDFDPDNESSVTVSLTCGEANVSPQSASASESAGAVFTVTGFAGNPTCTGTESPVPFGYNSTGPCAAALSEGSCTIFNYLNKARFEVEKDFSDDNTAPVTVTLFCDSGNVSPDSLSASEAQSAVFEVTGFTGDPNCTASESQVPDGYSSTGNCSAALVSVGHCTIVNTLNTRQFLVRKDFSDNSTADVTVSLSCGTATVLNDDTGASEADPANFTVTGFNGDPLCTGTESPIPTDYISTGNCSANLTTGECTIVNTLHRIGEFQVLKDFQPDSAASVSVSLSCGGGGNVSPGSGNASESTPAPFIVTGHTGDPTCTATEASVPAGYSSSGTCSAALSVGHCTIVNILNTDEFTVNKDFSDNSAASVTVSLTCASGNVSPASKPASEASPAVFEVTGFTGDPACTATEGTPPPGYTSIGSCSAALSVGHCTIFNNRNERHFLVRKVFSDHVTTSVTVTLACASGSVSPPTRFASEASPGDFLVVGFTGDPICNASETEVPMGYTSTAACSAALSAGECTIFNIRNEGFFEVRKDFSDNSAASVTVSLSCASGNASPDSAPASEALPASFAVTSFTGDPLCTGTENPVPAGYTSTGTCSATLSARGCTIVNTLVATPTPSPTPSPTPTVIPATQTPTATAPPTQVPTAPPTAPPSATATATPTPTAVPPTPTRTLEPDTGTATPTPTPPPPLPATSTPTPVKLPPTGGDQGGGQETPWLLLAGLGAVAFALACAWLAKRESGPAGG
ncbi:MAG: hypothetical protein Q7T33_02055, partial [Dehalococcoidia bacterium]|nr:hypothetical protein [Dehalococcoidia bacterium]